MARRSKKVPEVCMVWEVVKDFDRYSLEGSVTNVIANLQANLEAIPTEFRDTARIDISYDRGYYDSIELKATLEFHRPENEKEKVEREKRAAEWEERQRKNELAQLAALQKKYAKELKV